MKRIAIIGGGPGGLFTARLLTQKLNDGINITLFEAAARLGGKVLTARFEKSGIAFEGGTAELYDYSMHGPDPLQDLVTGSGAQDDAFPRRSGGLGDRILPRHGRYPPSLRHADPFRDPRLPSPMRRKSRP